MNSAGIWLRQAQGDLAARTLLADPEIPGWTVGFHAQQAVEKAFNAALTAAGTAFFPHPQPRDPGSAGA